MADKDPAFLFYSDNWIGGTSTMTFEDRGKYITILVIMHQKGRLKEETIRFLVGSISDTLKEKFLIDETGLWYNERLEKEVGKRRNFVETRRNNGKLGGRKPKSEPNEEPLGNPDAKPLAKPNENLPLNENENKDLIEINGVGSETSLAVEMQKIWMDEVPQYPQSQEQDLKALVAISWFIRKQVQLDRSNGDPYHKSKVHWKDVLDLWRQMIPTVLKDNFWSKKSLETISRSIQEIWQKSNKHGQRKQNQSNINKRIDEMFAGK